MKDKRDKDISYFRVLDALEKARQCPLCELESERVRRHVDGLIYELVNDPGIRAELIRSKGYCAGHAHVLLDFRDTLGTAILYQDQVHGFLDFLDNAADASPRAAARTIAQYAQHEECPLCRLQREFRERDVSTLIEGLLHEEMRGAFQACPGLCAPHFLLALKTAQDETVRKVLIETERLKFRDLLHDLEELCRKHDYRFQHEGLGKEADSWRRAVQMMVGKQDIPAVAKDPLWNS